MFVQGAVNMKTLSRMMISLVSVGVLASCASNSSAPENAEQEVTTQGLEEFQPYPYTGEQISGQSVGTSTVQAGTGQVESGPTATVPSRTVYFDYDSFEVQSQYRPVVEAQARYLASNPNTTVSLEGHTDPRGSREYNVALGERRSEAVRRLLGTYGANLQQIRAVSYGEEMRASPGCENESCYQSDRRVEIVYYK